MRETLLDTMEGVPGARWQDDDQLHVTLRYIGEVDGAMAEDVALALARIHHPSLGLALAGIGRFDRRKRINSLWAGVTPHDAVTALHRKIDTALVRLGLPPEGRAYLPHITLARFGRDAGPVEGFALRHAGLTGPVERFDAFYLYESILGAGGSVYEMVERYPLERAD